MDIGRQKLQDLMDDGLGRELMDAGRFCFSCEQIFANRKCLEEHVCSAASYICSCGTEFAEYKDMLKHSTTHERGHQVLDHETIKKRRLEKRIEEEEQLKRLQTGEVVWKPPKLPPKSALLTSKPVLQVPLTSAPDPAAPTPSAQISQVPLFYPSVSQTSHHLNPTSPGTDMKNIFAGVGAPTVDLWTLYQPVVLLNTEHKSNKQKPYSCGKCGQCFTSKASLVSHHSTHVMDKVSGCIGCGMLLSSKKVVPRFHVCNAPNNTAKHRLITAKPLRPIEPIGNSSQKLTVGMPQVTSFLPLSKSQNLNLACQASQASQITTPQVKNHVKRSTRELSLSPALLFKNQNYSASKLYVSIPQKSQISNLHLSSKSTQKFLAKPSAQLKPPIHCESGLSSNTTKTPSPSDALMCRVCHISFETCHQLQRHKCVKAREFMAQHAFSSKPHYKLNRVVGSPYPAQINGKGRLGIPVPGNMRNNEVTTVTTTTTLNKCQGVTPVNRKTTADLEDDCYIVESSPEKPAEVIYQVTSSVPIKT